MPLAEPPSPLDIDASAPPASGSQLSGIQEEIWDESFPTYKRAGATLGNSKMLFETYRDDQILKGAEILGPFSNDAEWLLVKWLIKNVGHNQAEEFLKLPIVC